MFDVEIKENERATPKHRTEPRIYKRIEDGLLVMFFEDRDGLVLDIGDSKQCYIRFLEATGFITCNDATVWRPFYGSITITQGVGDE